MKTAPFSINNLYARKSSNVKFYPKTLNISRLLNMLKYSYLYKLYPVSSLERNTFVFLGMKRQSRRGEKKKTSSPRFIYSVAYCFISDNNSTIPSNLVNRYTTFQLDVSGHTKTDVVFKIILEK